MATQHVTKLNTSSAEATESLGEMLGKRLRGGEVIELASDLGGGKTTFVRGLARGFGSPDRVASPTFTLSREYNAGERKIVHFDLYRLSEAGIVASEFLEEALDPSIIVVVEWADVVADILPANRLTVTLSPTSENGRSIILACPEPLQYLLEMANS